MSTGCRRDGSSSARAALLLMVLGTGAAAGADYPTKGVRIILPYAPGGGADAVTRIVAQKLADTWRQSVVVDNRPGAGATLGTEMVARAAPDGYTLLVTAGTLTVSPAAYPNLPYDVIRDFAPITPVARSAYVLAVHPSVRANSVDALLRLARAQPNRLNFASAGTGTLAHLNVELLKARTGIRVAHVPYKGSNPALIGLLAGEVDAVFDTPAAVLPHVRAGKLRALAVSTATRTPSAKDVPTLVETGVRDFDVSVWFGLLAPAGTPAEVIRAVHADTLKVLAAPDVVERISAIGQDVMTLRPDEFSALIRSEVAKWRELVKHAGIRFE